MQGFEAFGDGAVRFTSAQPDVVLDCTQQANGTDCGMCIAGFALALALGLSVDSLPTQYSRQLRKRWHDCLAEGLHNKRHVILSADLLKGT